MCNKLSHETLLLFVRFERRGGVNRLANVGIVVLNRSIGPFLRMGRNFRVVRLFLDEVLCVSLISEVTDLLSDCSFVQSIDRRHDDFLGFRPNSSAESASVVPVTGSGI